MESIEQHIQKDKEILDDPTPLELDCDANPEALECRVYDD